MEPEDEPLMASKIREPLSSPARSLAWTETGTSQDIDVEDENDPVDIPFSSDEMEDEDHESLVTMDDDTEIFIPGRNSDSQNLGQAPRHPGMLHGILRAITIVLSRGLDLMQTFMLSS